jgi:hypothetical protein
MHELNKTKDKSIEKAFKQNLFISVVGIILCMIVLSSTTWAWFTADISSADNTIKSAYCDVAPSVECGGVPVESRDGIYELLGGVQYDFTISASGTADSAYCILRIDGNDYYTVQIPTREPDNCITFSLQFTDATEVEVITRWGTSSKTERAIHDGILYIDLTDSAPTP